jgi:hypothetical protein
MGCRFAVLLTCHCVNFAALAGAGALLIGWSHIACHFVLASSTQTADGGGGDGAVRTEAVLLGAVLVAASLGPLISAAELFRPRARSGGRSRGAENLPLGVLQPALVWFAVLVAALYLQTALSDMGL